MITREEIRSIPELHKSIKSDREQLMYLQEKATSLPSMSDSEKVQTSPDGNVNKYSEEAVDLDREIQIKELELLELQKRAKVFIDTVKDPLAKRVLKMRYLKCYKWEEIAELTGYDIRWIQRKEGREVNKLTVVGHAG